MAEPLTTDQALSQLDAALDALAAWSAVPGSVQEAADLTRLVEQAGRRVHAVQVALVESIEESGVHVPDGHASASILVAHIGRLSQPERKRRDRARRMFAAMPAVKAATAAGHVGRCQVNRIAQVWANPRVRTELERLDDQVAALAAHLSYDELDRRLLNWVRQVDEDGTADRSRQAHENRRARLVQDFDGGWELLCRIGSVTGAQMQSIFRAFVDAEFAADWAEAFEVHGDQTAVEHLARTFDQRDADAIARIFEFAANGWAASPGGAPITTAVVMDHETFEREARRAAGADLEPRPAPDLGPMPGGTDGTEGASQDPDAPVPHPGRAFRCETSDGHPIDPTEAFANALVGRVRRLVVGWDSVVLDASGLHKLFTGPLREATLFGHHACYWTGCPVSVRHCQVDHLDPRRSGGRTNPGNGAPACGRHNRLKEHGFTVRRDERGRLHVHRPDGTEIEY